MLEDAGDVARQKRCGHEHGHGNGESVGALHALGVLEQQHDEDAADPHDVVDERNIELALGVAGVVDAQVRHELRRVASDTSENEPVMSACEAMMAATAESTMAKGRRGSGSII